MWSSRRRQRRRRTDGVHVAGQPRLTNVVSRHHGLVFELPRELARSRRHGHEFSLIMLRDTDPGPLAQPRRSLRDVIDRLALRLRLTDLLIHLDEDRLLVACPETGTAGARVLLSDLIGLASADGVTVRAGLATFPTSALTATELLRACEREAALDQPRDAGDVHERYSDDLHAITHESGRR